MDADEREDRMAAREAEHIDSRGYCTDCGGLVIGGNMGHFPDCPREDEPSKQPDWRGDLLSVQTERCVGCGKDLARLLKSGKTIIHGGHLCTYRKGIVVTAGWCEPCRRQVEPPKERASCIGCYGFWDSEKHGGVVEKWHEDAE